VAGGCGQAEALEELGDVRFELVEDPSELGQTLCATVAGGCGQAEGPEELGAVRCELVEDLSELGQALCLTVAGGRGQAEALEELGAVFLELVGELPQLLAVLSSRAARPTVRAPVLDTTSLTLCVGFTRVSPSSRRRETRSRSPLRDDLPPRERGGNEGEVFR
jgi:hypothetical protein